MQSPSVEIHAVIRLITASATPDIQKAAIYKYFTVDAGYCHPLCAIEPAPESREGILGVYQWFRTLSPDTQVNICDVVYDRLHSVVYVEFQHTFNFRFSPFTAMPCRVMSRFSLRKEEGLHYICKQEDFMHPDDVTALICPPAAPIARMILSVAAISSRFCTNWLQLFGIWRAPRTVDHVNVHDIATKPSRPRAGEGRMRHRKSRELARAIKRSQEPIEIDDLHLKDDNIGDLDVNIDIFEEDPFGLQMDDGYGVWNVIDAQSISKNEYTVPKTNGKRFGDDFRARNPFTTFATGISI